MNDLAYERTLLPDGTKVRIARTEETVFIVREDGSRVQLPMDKYLSGLIGMAEKRLGRRLTARELNEGISRAHLQRGFLWVFIVVLIGMLLMVVLRWID